MITYPNFGPWSEHQSNYTWLIITASELKGQTTLVRDANAVTPGAMLKQWKLLAPSEISYGFNHNWAQYQNMTSRMADAIAKYGLGIKDAGQLGINVTSRLIGQQFTQRIFGSGGVGGGAALDTSGKAVYDLFGTNVINYRPDAPLVYKSSENLSYTFDFDFIAYDNDRIIIEEIVQPMQVFSCPSKQYGGQGGTGGVNPVQLDPPAVWSIETVPSGLMKLKYAALTNIRVVMKEPYVHGKPIEVKLNLTFKDLLPLFRDSNDAQAFTVTSSVPF